MKAVEVLVVNMVNEEGDPLVAEDTKARMMMKMESCLNHSVLSSNLLMCMTQHLRL